MASMQNTASEESTKLRYDFSFAWESAYGHVVELLKRLGLEPGLVIDLGCGTGSIAEPLGELGYSYVGADIDRNALAQLTRRGLEGHELDLSQTEDLAARMLDLAHGRRVAAVLLLDVIEHMPETQRLLSAVREGLDLFGHPPLLVSVPNVAHADLAAKLTFGRWDYTPTGLLDSTHVQLFTSDHLQAQARASGLLEVDAHDFQLRSSDQHFPPDHPALSWIAPIAATIRMWRDAADSHGDTIQFVRAFVSCDIDRAPNAADAAVASASTTSLTVVMRTQGRRQAHLRDALTCLAAQTLDDFDVLLMVHSPEPEVTVPSVKALVDEFDPTFASRVSVVHVAGGGRARPLNVALTRLSAGYVAFLDDDDMVTADWVESFVDAAGEGAIVRSVAAVRHVSIPETSDLAPYLIHSALEFRYELDFDPVHHLWGNETPICTFAVPRSLIETFNLRFDEQLPVLEDWEFLMHCAMLAPVRDTKKVTSIYQMWRSGESSASLHEIALWQATQRVLQGRSNTRPIVLPAGSADRLVKMCEQIADFEPTRLALSRARSETQTHAEDNQRLRYELEELRDKYLVTVNSRRWQLLGPPARMLAAIRRLRPGASS